MKNTDKKWKYVKCIRYINYTNDTLTPSKHPFLEIIYCVSGNLQYTIEEKTFTFSTGDLLIIPPGTIHVPTLKEPFSEPYDRILLYIDMDYFEQTCNSWPVLLEHRSFFSESKLIHTPNTNYSALRKYFDFCCNTECWEPQFITPYMYGMVLGLLSELLAIHHFETTAFKDEECSLIDQILLYVKEHLSEKLTLENTAKRFHINQSSFSRLFYNELNISFYNYVTKQRLVSAKELIIQGTKLSSIGSLVGFKDYSNFYRAFKKEYGISPKEYQKTLK